MSNSSLTLYPNAKINIGLNIVRKRPDGYHDIESLFCPIPLLDELRIERSESFSFKLSGIELDGNLSDNLVVKAYRLMDQQFHLPPVAIRLEKKIPVGAGLGGGSSDAAFMLRGLNELFNLNCDDLYLAQMAAQLGSDCPFFIYNRPMMATGRGEILKPYELALGDVWILLVKPAVFVSTAQAYRGVVPSVPSESLEKVLQNNISDWRSLLKNDFEENIFPLFPEIAAIKEQLYHMGSIYASMSGSGSAVYGLFRENPNVESCKFRDKIVLQSKLH